ncbi:hypothetical protein ACNAN0_06475 [Agrilactobacillus fermenti]|uniref:hypothetical protein n=1 Tax=Agrilactobacillus fermenti TaxID=2586909 RepID=UPI001E574E5F|nr:hypothetical protein [Agrilactobacillus fermenti]MCD2255791.1 hypothetical protein [Agrilactobacillus fermenti]
MSKTTGYQNFEFAKLYIEFLRNQVFKFNVMDDVFNEYDKTILNVDNGNCLASENLHDLKEYYSKNKLKYDQLCDQMNIVPVPDDYEMTHKKIVRALEQYQASLSACSDAIDPFNNEICSQIIRKQNSRRTKAKEKMEAALDKIQQLKMCF